MTPRLLAVLVLLGLLGACGRTITISVGGGLPAVAVADRGDPEAAPRGTERVLTPTPWGYRAVAEPVRLGRVAERYELRYGDCGGGDCGNFRARAEVAEVRDRAPGRLDRDLWIGWSFRNGTIPPAAPGASLGVVVGQWKLGPDQPSLIRLVQRAAPAAGLPGDPTGDVVVQLDEVAGAQGWGPERNDGDICRLFSMEAARSRWMDIVINTNFGTDGAGYLRAWVNGELRCNYLGPIVSAERARTLVPGPTFRRGVFASFTRPWAEANGGAPWPTLVAYWDEVRTGASRAEVDPRVREARGEALD